MYSFGAGRAEGSSAMRDLLGGKGCELAEMTSLGVPVPPGFTITTEAWAAYHASGKAYPAGLWSQVEAGLAQLEKTAGRKLGDPERPLLVSVRSGARDTTARAATGAAGGSAPACPRLRHRLDSPAYERLPGSCGVEWRQWAPRLVECPEMVRDGIRRVND